MKRKTFYRLLQLLALTLPLQAISCGGDDEEIDDLKPHEEETINNDENKEGQNKEDNETKDNNFSDPALTFTVTACERIGRSLVVDFEVKNNTHQVMHNLQITDRGTNEAGLVYPNFHAWPTDNTGEYYPSYYILMGKVMHKDNYIIKELGSTPVIGHIVVPQFDPEGKATKVSVDKLVYCDDYKFNGFLDCGVLRLDNLPVVDNRTSVWSPDRTLVFEAGQWNNANNGYNDISLKFTVHNKCDEPIRDLALWVGPGDSNVPYGLCDSKDKSWWGFIWRKYYKVLDGEQYECEDEIYRVQMRVEGGEWVGTPTISLEPWESVNCELLVCDYDGTNILSTAIGCNTGERVLADNYAHILNIPVNR